MVAALIPQVRPVQRCLTHSFERLTEPPVNVRVGTQPCTLLHRRSLDAELIQSGRSIDADVVNTQTQVTHGHRSPSPVVRGVSSCRRHPRTSRRAALLH